LFLIISCSATDKTEKEPHPKYLNYQQFIPELSGKLVEISGLLIYDDLFWGFNDSGGQNKIYAFNKSGKIKKEIELENAKNRDWESITQDDKNIYIGDFGNNMGGRDNLRIYKIKKEDIKKGETQKVEAKKISFTYANQNEFTFFDKTTPFDCEAMVEYNGKLYLFSKNWKERTTTVYRIPTKKGDYQINPIETFNVNGLITGADISPNKKKLALVGYENFQSFIWVFSNFTDDNFFKGESQYFNLNKLVNTQTEGICFLGNDSVLVSCEKTSAYNQQVFLFDLTEIDNGTH